MTVPSDWEQPQYVHICPPGEAENSHYLRRDDHLPLEDLTVRPRNHAPFHTHGQGFHTLSIRGKKATTHLWWQEAIIFYKEMTPYFAAQILLQAMEDQARKDKEEGRDPISGRKL